MLSTNKEVHAEDTFCYRDYTNLQHVCNRFNTSFCTKDHETHLAISCYILLHQAPRSEGKNSSRKRRDILVSDRDQQRFFIIIIT